MAYKHQIAKQLHEKYIANTLPKAIVVDVTVLVCDLTKATQREIEKILSLKEGDGQRVYINTRVIKHLYDGKPAEEYDFVLCNIHKVIKKPDEIYKNKNPKRGEVLFIKVLNGQKYLCSLEKVEEGLMVVTSFRLRKENYLNNYELLWRWKGGGPSS